MCDKCHALTAWQPWTELELIFDALVSSQMHRMPRPRTRRRPSISQPRCCACPGDIHHTAQRQLCALCAATGATCVACAAANACVGVRVSQRA